MSRQTRVNSDILDLSQHVGLTPNQNNQLFEIYRRKIEQEKRDEIARATQVKELIDKTTELMKRKTQLEMNLMKRESNARIATTTAVVIAAISAALLKTRFMNEEDDLIDEILFEVQALNVRYASLSQDEIVKIFLNKFKSINLYRLRHMCDLQYDKLNDMNRIDIEDEMLRLRKTSRIYKNFEKSFHEM
jgi:hypothetical protein